MKPTVALIGCGRIGFLLEDDPLRYKPCTHYGGAKAAKLSITHACDINEKRLNAFSKIAGIPKSHCYTDYQKLLEEVKPSCVIIASWTHTHVPIGIAAAQLGAKVIVCEKPIASNLTQAKAFINACNTHNTTLIINHERRYDYRYNYVKKLIGKNEIGHISSVHGFVFTPSKTHQPGSGGGPLLHDGTHLIDIVQYLFGNIAQAQGFTTRYSQDSLYEDYAIAHCMTTSGLHVILEAGGHRDYFMFELQIFGTKGRIVIGNGYLYLYKPKTSRYYQGFKDLVALEITPKGNPDYFVKLYKEAKKCLHKPATVTSSGYDGYKALEVIHAIYTSANHNGRIITLG
ncbi:MAG TPA: Gfo/Idh/MocA family oxidoreductase [Spirochaetota bacterium]|nr:Gfo/Idh/MocA family oxidoreductase [Spirochaetota bacterium]